VPISVRTSEETRNFYDDLVRGSVTRSIWGKDRRFDPIAIAAKRSVQRHFVPAIRRYLASSDFVLDLGCGPGGFTISAAPLCRHIVAADITPSFVELANRSLAEQGVSNAKAEVIGPGKLPYADGTFDRVLMVDTIHHLEDAASTMAEVHRVLKPGGVLLIFEPNKRNPVLWFMCLIDRNEHGLLRLGISSKYEALLGPRYEIIESRYNGLLIGPDGRLSEAVADLVSRPALSAWLGWLSPKLFIAARKTK
jgi:ubiquinone/menaquinone biosynthesis C-methylase UbiE